MTTEKASQKCGWF